MSTTCKSLTIALALLASAMTGCQHAATLAERRSGATVPELRLLDSFCAGGTCERVYTRYSKAELQRGFRQGDRTGVPFEPFIVRVEPDPASRTARP